ncbi:MAG: hypothetical protein K1X81_00335 [Bacteroidia bacterium]|nr:hypothetical protein [Bacteroidia bacterium]
MKHLTLFTAIMTMLALHVQAQSWTFEEDSIVKVNGQKICTVLKTKKASIMAGTIAEFTVYDVTGTPRFLFEGMEGKIMFLDDKKSYLPRVCDAYAKELAQFFGTDSILTAQGYNTAYRDAFIKKHRGYNASATLAPGGGNERDRSAPVSYIETQILQGGVPIGSYENFRMPNQQNYSVHVFNLSKKLIAKINVAAPDRYYTINVTITDASGKVIHTYSDTNATYLFKKGISWLAKNGYL